MGIVPQNFLKARYVILRKAIDTLPLVGRQVTDGTLKTAFDRLFNIDLNGAIRLHIRMGDSRIIG